MSFRLVPKSVTLNDLERRNGPILRYFIECGSFLGALCISRLTKVVKADKAITYGQLTITMSSSN